ncbi:MAG: hypoxanthine phosphoribosyltransferase [Oligoflexia bacterium]|nr:hypoxanthine phosphoribosyltransferase [Oligoflexia bacterium]
MTEPAHGDTHIRMLISQERIAQRTEELAREVREGLGDGPITCIGVLKGSFIFMADFVRALGGPVRCEFLGVSSYHGGTRSTGVVRITEDLRHPIEGQHCLLIEDIVDTGLTLDYLTHFLAQRKPASIQTVALLDKPAHREVEICASHVGFTIPDEFVVGYGLDLGELYRNLPFIGVYSP